MLVRDTHQYLVSLVQTWLSADAWAQCSSLYPYPDPSVGGDCGLDHAPCLPSALFNALVAPLTVGPGESSFLAVLCVTVVSSHAML